MWDQEQLRLPASKEPEPLTKKIYNIALPVEGRHQVKRFSKFNTSEPSAGPFHLQKHEHVGCQSSAMYDINGSATPLLQQHSNH